MRHATVLAWLPIVLLPAAVVLWTPADWPRWGFMWLLAAAIFIGCKWLTWLAADSSGATAGRQVGYLIAWPGLDAAGFLQGLCLSAPPFFDWLFAFVKLTFGIAIIVGVYPLVRSEHELIGGWIGMIGVVFVLHFGLFDLIQLAWNAAGVNAKPLMDWPILATSVSDFWGKRWNSAFRDLTHRYLFRPLTERFGPKTALAIGFFFSGVVHDLVISLPARGGYGGPTIFFILQAAAIFFERAKFGRRLGLGRGARGWAFAMFVLAGPAMLLFHPPFVRGVVVPFLDKITQAQG